MNYGAKHREIYRLLMRVTDARWMVLRDRATNLPRHDSPGNLILREARDNRDSAGFLTLKCARDRSCCTRKSRR